MQCGEVVKAVCNGDAEVFVTELHNRAGILPKAVRQTVVTCETLDKILTEPFPTPNNPRLPLEMVAGREGLAIALHDLKRQVDGYVETAEKQIAPTQTQKSRWP